MSAAFRTRVRSLWQPSFRRTFYSKRAEFTTMNALGLPTTGRIDVWLGDPHEAYVIVPPHVGKALQAASKGRLRLTASQDTYSLVFDHSKRQFSCIPGPFPQLAIPQDLPSSADQKASSATLFYSESAPTNTIALDGTPDFEFAKQTEESCRELKSAIDNLKNR